MSSSSIIMYPKPLIISPTTKHTATVIFAHGLGDTSDGWSFLGNQLGKVMPWVKWILPQAPTQSVTLNMGIKMPSWFDIKSLNPPQLGVGVNDEVNKSSSEDESGLMASAKMMEDLAFEEIEKNGIKQDRVIVGGFSQGGAIGLLSGLTAKLKPGGIIALSSFLPLSGKIVELRNPESSSIPVFWGHGTADPVVQYQWGKDSVQFLKENLAMEKVNFNSYDGLTHSAHPQEIKDLFAWFMYLIPEKFDN